MEKREGRGRLSSIELLPAEADEAVAWAAAELIDRTRTADDIHAEFNGKLAAIGLGPILDPVADPEALGEIRITGGPADVVISNVGA